MPPDDRTKLRRRLKRKRLIADDESSQETISPSQWFILGLSIIAVLCLVIGCVSHGFDWANILAACGCLVTGIAFVAIGLLELEWLERIVGFVDGIFSGLTQWFWTTSFGTLSDSELIGRRGATVIWVVIGFPIYVWGCLMALRVFGF